MKKILAICMVISGLAHFALAQSQVNQVDALLKRGEVFLEEYEFEKALVVCDEALKKIQSAKRRSPAKLAAVYYLYGRIYEEGLYLEKAIAAYTTALKFDARDAEIYRSRAFVYEYTGEKANAVADFEKARNLTEKGRNSKLTVLVGDKNDRLEEIPEIFMPYFFKEVRHSLEIVDITDLDRNGKISRDEYINAHVSRLLKLNKLVGFNPKSDLALWKRGNFYLRLNEFISPAFWVSADVDFTNAFELNPRYEYLVNRGVVRANRNNKTNDEFAVKMFSDALEINAKSVKAYYNRGLSYLRLNENEKAIADFTKVIELDPKFIIAYKSRARAFRAAGKTADADADEKLIKMPQ